jgi:hypothetical protein
VTPSSHLLLFSSPASRLTHLFPFLVILTITPSSPWRPALSSLACFPRIAPLSCSRSPAFFALPFLPFFTRLTPAPHDTTILVTLLAIFCSLYVRTYKDCQGLKAVLPHYVCTHIYARNITHMHAST